MQKKKTNIVNNIEKHKFDKPDECPICFDPILDCCETPLQCGHWMHKRCINSTNLHKCSLCQTQMSIEEINYIFGEGHIEHNEYDNGNSIHWNHEEHDENAYDEFGHGSDDDYDSDDEDDDDTFPEIVNENDKQALLNYNDETTRNDVNDMMMNLTFETRSTITTDIQRLALQSEYLIAQNILMHVPNDEYDEQESFCTETINNILGEHFDSINGNGPNCFTRNKETCIRITAMKLGLYNECCALLNIYWNACKYERYDGGYFKNNIFVVLKDVLVKEMNKMRIRSA